VTSEAASRRRLQTFVLRSTYRAALARQDQSPFDRGARSMPAKQKIKTFLWFDNNAEEAMNFYVSIFRNSRIVEVVRIGDARPGATGSIVSGTFELEGQRFMALNGGPHFKFTEAISLFVDCDTQEEVDELWDKLSAGGQVQQCGWLKDRFGLSWQIIPEALSRMFHDKDPAKSKRVMDAIMQMQKIDIARLKQAYDGA
jgi:predicted 3-demethylubiquinone-9 3-methyltransferase (glyoxalase superfamily)